MGYGADGPDTNVGDIGPLAETVRDGVAPIETGTLNRSGSCYSRYRPVGSKASGRYIGNSGWCVRANRLSWAASLESARIIVAGIVVAKTILEIAVHVRRVPSMYRIVPPICRAVPSAPVHDNRAKAVSKKEIVINHDRAAEPVWAPSPAAPAIPS